MFGGWTTTYGGSYPPGLNGWHRAIRRTARHAPRAAPYFSTARTAYSLHVGVNRQVGPISGDTQHWYARTAAIRSHAGALRKERNIKSP